MGLTAKMTTGRGPILRPGQVLLRSVAASPGPKNDRIMVAPVRKRPKRVAKKIAQRFGILHFRDVPVGSIRHRVEVAALVGATVAIDQARLVADGDGAQFDFRQKSISWNALHSHPADDQMGGRIIRRPDTIDDLDTLAGKPSVIGEPSD